MSINSKAIAQINYEIVADIKKELRLQGHYLTGELERSFEEKEIFDEFEIVLEAFAFAFLKDLERGVPASEIGPLDVNSDEFRGLVKWVRLRGLETAGERYMSASSIAEAIWRKWQKKGKPLETSKQFSKTGEILGAIETVFERKGDEVFSRIDDEVVLTIDKKFFDDNNK
ncbi:MAG: hypothetical protein LC112_13980 [Flavobacteriales bacterium]|nr:hypothetical protein [Flavobacteriales bacterium]